MIVLLSPSKSQDFETPAPFTEVTQPRFLAQSEELVANLRQKSAREIMGLMAVSEKIAALNVDRYRSFRTPFTPLNAKPCAFAFTGDVYDGLDAGTLTAPDLQYAQKTLRILSGLYGLLRPLDLIQPYRLEMGTRLANRAGADLYAYWREALTAALAEEAPAMVVNLASQEYAGAVQLNTLGTCVVTPVFKDRKGEQYKIISFFAKRARGRMARWLIETRAGGVEEVRRFDGDGYRYSPELSSPAAPVFLRD